MYLTNRKNGEPQNLLPSIPQSWKFASISQTTLAATLEKLKRPDENISHELLLSLNLAYWSQVEIHCINILVEITRSLSRGQISELSPFQVLSSLPRL